MTALHGAIFCLIWVVVAVCLAMLIHRFVPKDYFEDHYEQAGFIFAVIGVVYAVILAFVAIGAWERFESAEVRTYAEAASLIDVYRDATVFPAQRTHIRSELRRYTDLVVSDDWPKMAQLQESTEAHDALEQLTADITVLKPATNEQQDVHQSMLGSIERALSERAARVSMSATGLNALVWYILGGGAAVTFRRRVMQVVMVGALAFSISIVYYLVSALDFPFRGDISVQPHAFENAAKTYDEIDVLTRSAAKIRVPGTSRHAGAS